MCVYELANIIQFMVYNYVRTRNLSIYLSIYLSMLIKWLRKITVKWVQIILIYAWIPLDLAIRRRRYIVSTCGSDWQKTRFIFTQPKEWKKSVQYFSIVCNRRDACMIHYNDECNIKVLKRAWHLLYLEICLRSSWL